METEAATFSRPASSAPRQAYEDTFEEEKGGRLDLAHDVGQPLGKSSSQGRSPKRATSICGRWISRSIGSADCVDGKLEAAKQRVAEGLTQVDIFVAGP